MKLILGLLLFCISSTVIGQQTTSSPKFGKEIDNYLELDVDTITVQQVVNKNCDFVFLDAREEEEYTTSHIPKARYIGFDDFRASHVRGIPLDAPIVVYCSIGYRSEKVGVKLQELGYTNVKNLYGSIFEWVNQGHPIIDSEEKPTTKIHTYNKKWSKWVTNDDYTKVW